jgi:hypothetical protein
MTLGELPQKNSKERKETFFLFVFFAFLCGKFSIWIAIRAGNS